MSKYTIKYWIDLDWPTFEKDEAYVYNYLLGKYMGDIFCIWNNNYTQAAHNFDRPITYIDATVNTVNRELTVTVTTDRPLANREMRLLNNLGVQTFVSHDGIDSAFTYNHVHQLLADIMGQGCSFESYTDDSTFQEVVTSK